MSMVTMSRPPSAAHGGILLQELASDLCVQTVSTVRAKLIHGHFPPLRPDCPQLSQWHGQHTLSGSCLSTPHTITLQPFSFQNPQFPKRLHAVYFMA